jgi:4-hydroxybenzoate polyprenyltransferase
MALAWASSVTTSLPDAPSDKATGKKSLAVLSSELAARRASLFVIALGASATPLVVPRAPSWALFAMVAVPIFVVFVNRRNLRDADAEHAAACFRFVTLNGVAIAAALVGWTVALFLV